MFTIIFLVRHVRLFQLRYKENNFYINSTKIIQLFQLFQLFQILFVKDTQLRMHIKT